MRLIPKSDKMVTVSIGEKGVLAGEEKRTREKLKRKTTNHRFIQSVFISYLLIRNFIHELVPKTTRCDGKDTKSIGEANDL